MLFPYLNWLNESMTHMSYPEQTIAYITDTYKKICNDKRANTLLHTTLQLYEKQLMPDWNWALDSAERAANQISVHKFVGHFVFSLCATKHVKTFYEQKGMPDGCFEGFLNDIKIKYNECVTLHKVHGICVARWFNRFVDGTRHTFGRLQFEPIFMGCDYKKDGIAVAEGDLAINIHIPGGSKLLKQDCIDSFLAAAEFYAELFEDKKVVFYCHSWLLYPEHKEFLPESSNILMFADFFNIVESAEQKGDLWRIFGQTDCEDVASLPEKTSLQKAFKNRLMNGGKIGSGAGLFIVKDGKIIK